MLDVPVEMASDPLSYVYIYICIYICTEIVVRFMIEKVDQRGERIIQFDREEK